MKKEFITQQEIERYELESEPLYDSRMDRRQFFKILGGGILVFSSIQLSTAGALVDERREHAGERNPEELAAWLHIGQDGTVKVYTGKVEVGQNIRTSLSQAVAEELMVPMETIEMIMGDTFLTPYDRGTFGSLTTPTMLPVLRRAAASMREVLKELAAEKWNISAKSLTAIDGEIQNPKNKESIKYGALTEGKEIVREIVSDISTIPPEEWRIASEPVHKVRGDEFVTGKHEYASDIQRPGMHHAKILRPPAFDAELKMLDTSQAEAMLGVTVVREGNFVGVAAPSQAAAEKAVKALRAKWSTRPQIANQELFDHLKKTAQGGAGSVEQGWKAADRRLEQTYHINYIAHTPLEPRAAVAEWDGDRLTVWTGTQRPFGVQDELSRAFDLPKEQIHVIMPDTGSGYGGKHTGEAAVEAARIARATGKPVKLNWTREEEFTWAYFRPAGVIDCKAGMKNDGRLTAWEFHNYNSGGSGLRAFYYAIPNKKEEFHRADSPLRQGSYRCLAATANHFARESFMDELAHVAGMDPLDFRLKNLKDERLRHVFERVAEEFGWGKETPTRERGFGLAGGFEKNAYVATAAEVAIDRQTGEVRVVRVVEGFDNGPVINPDHLRSQIEGMIMMGIGGALYEKIEFENGRILNPRLSQYQVPRFADLPKIETILIDRQDIPSAGGGETPIVGIAPAIGNAIFQATGKRLRTMPLAPDGLKL